MTLAGFVQKNLFRDSLRANVSFVAVMLAFLLYVLVRALSGAVDADNGGGSHRIIVTNSVSAFAGIPETQFRDIADVTGVEALTPFVLFAGQLPRTRSQVIGLGVDARSYDRVYSDVHIAARLRADWLNERRGIVIGRKVAELRGWRTGDIVQLESLNIARKDGQRDWQFVVVGVFEADEGSMSEQAFLAHIDYIMGNRIGDARRADMVGVRGADSISTQAVSKRIEEAFRYQFPQLKAQQESAFMRGMIEQFGDLKRITFYLLAFVLTILLVVLFNGLAISIGARLREYATLKTLGFTSGTIMGTVLAEAVALVSGAAMAGAVAALLILAASQDTLRSVLPVSYDAFALIIEVFAVSVAIALAIGITPALLASRQSVTQALRGD